MLSYSGTIVQVAPFSSDSTCPRQGPFAPSCFQDFFATMGLSDSRLRQRNRLFVPGRPVVPAPRRSGSPRFLDQSLDTRRPLSPRRARSLLLPVPSRPALGFAYPGRLATPRQYNEADSGSLTLRLMSSPYEASPDRVTPSHARSATCQTGNLQGKLLSACKIGQAYPGAPGFTGLIWIFDPGRMPGSKSSLRLRRM